MPLRKNPAREKLWILSADIRLKKVRGTFPAITRQSCWPAAGYLIAWSIVSAFFIKNKVFHVFYRGHLRTIQETGQLSTLQEPDGKRWIKDNCPLREKEIAGVSGSWSGNVSRSVAAGRWQGADSESRPELLRADHHKGRSQRLPVSRSRWIQQTGIFCYHGNRTTGSHPLRCWRQNINHWDRPERWKDPCTIPVAVPDSLTGSVFTPAYRKDPLSLRPSLYDLEAERSPHLTERWGRYPVPGKTGGWGSPSRFLERGLECVFITDTDRQHVIR